MSMSENGLSLKVLEAYTRDVGRGVARIDFGLNAEIIDGNVISIQNIPDGTSSVMWNSNLVMVVP